jgi:carnitine 3-dehydrogenase
MRVSTQTVPHLVAVIGEDDLAAQWCARLLARGCGVTFVDLSTSGLTDAVMRHFTSSQRMGTFPRSALSNLCRITSLEELVPVEFGFVSVPHNESALVSRIEERAPHMLIAAHRTITDRTTRATAIAPANLVPLVSVEGPRADRLVEVLNDVGFRAVVGLPTAENDERYGTGLIQLGGDDPDTVLALLRALRATNTGAGVHLADWEARTLATDSARWTPGDAVPAPLDAYRTTVNPDWVDYNGHMTESAYLVAFGWATDVLFRFIGDDEAYRAAGHSFYTVETHITYEREALLNEPLRITTRVLDVDTKRLQIYHEMFHAETGDRLSTSEQMLLHVDMHAQRSAPILPDVATALAAVHASHRVLPMPDGAGRTMHIIKK